MVYIYGLLCPIAGVIRYVGKSSNPAARRRKHILAALRGATNHHAARWIRTIATAGLEPALVILHHVADGESWQDAERAFIASAAGRGWRLTNSTAGGEGLDYIDPADRAKWAANLSATMKALWNRPERRAEARARVILSWSDPERAERRVASVRSAHKNPKLKAKMREVGREVGSRPEVLAAKSAACKAMWADPETRAERQAAFDGARTKMSTSAKARWADPAKTAVLLEVRAGAEFRKKIAEAAVRRATPEYRAMMAEKTRLSWAKRRDSNRAA